MTKSDIALLLGFASVLDYRIEADLLKVGAWHLTLSAHMDYEWARDMVTKHYASSKEAITPAILNNEFRLMLKGKNEKQLTRETMLEIEQAHAGGVPPEKVSEYIKQIKNQIQINKQRNDDENS